MVNVESDTLGRGALQLLKGDLRLKVLLVVNVLWAERADLLLPQKVLWLGIEPIRKKFGWKRVEDRDSIIFGWIERVDNIRSCSASGDRVFSNGLQINQ